MYGLGLAKGLGVTLKNLLLPGRMFTLHQYPDRRIGVLGLAKMSGANVIAYVLRNPGMAARAMVGLASVQDRDYQHPRFRGEEFTFYEERCTGCASCAKYCPLGIIRIVTDPSGEAVQEGENYGIEVFDIDIAAACSAVCVSRPARTTRCTWEAASRKGRIPGASWSST